MLAQPEVYKYGSSAQQPADELSARLGRLTFRLSLVAKLTGYKFAISSKVG